LTTEPSLAALNGKIRAYTRGESPLVKMSQFRPNIVVDAPQLDAWAEDGWKKLRIGRSELVAVRPCSRCIVPTIDPATAQKNPFGEPLQTLRRHRQLPDGSVYFGQHLVHLQVGTSITIGDTVHVLSTKPAELLKSALPPPKVKSK